MSEVRIRFSKSGPARFISHLDLMHTLQRAFFRAGIAIRHTEGFNPHPYVSIPLPLSVGFSSDCELMEFGLEGGATPDDLPTKLTTALPEGITVLHCYPAVRPFRELAYVRYRVTLEFASPAAEEAAAAFRALLGRDSLVVAKRSKKAKSGYTQLDLIPLVRSLDRADAAGGTLTLELVLKAQNPGLNPTLLLSAFADAYPAFTPVFAAYHRLDVLDEQLHPFA